ncbi:MAG: RraA family protein [Pseudomonadota bacterium]
MNIADFAAYPTASLCNANPAVLSLSSAIKPLIPGKRIAGPARTARITPGQNAAIHRAVHEAALGDVLVVDGAGSDRFGPFGDLLADGCKAKGVAGAVFDCTVRDRADIAALGFQVFARGFHPEATAKTDPGSTDIPVTVGGIRVCPGDIVVGDDDGVVVIPALLGPEILEQAAAVTAREDAIRTRIQAGETTYEIFGLGRGATAVAAGKDGP